MHFVLVGEKKSFVAFLPSFNLFGKKKKTSVAFYLVSFLLGRRRILSPLYPKSLEDWKGNDIN